MYLPNQLKHACIGFLQEAGHRRGQCLLLVITIIITVVIDELATDFNKFIKDIEKLHLIFHINFMGLL